MPNTSAEVFPYGEWPSPITAADVARGHVTLSFPTLIGSTVWWQETRPAEGGRQTVVRQGPDGVIHELLPAPWNARTRVHEYGGRSYLPVGDELLFANFADQRLYLYPADGGAPRVLTADGDRFADFVLSPASDEIWCVRERHADGKITRAIVAVPLDGSAATSDAARVLVSGSDFFAFPTPSPDGSRLAWICWDHPRMPWDGTSLRVGHVGPDGVSEPHELMGGTGESAIAPAWRDTDSLYAMSDRSGWWNLYLCSLDGSSPEALCPREEEFAAPLWQLGSPYYTPLSGGRIAVTHGTGDVRLAVLDPSSGSLTDVEMPYRVFSLAGASGTTVAGLAGTPAIPLSVVTVDVTDGTVRELRAEENTLPDAGYLPTSRAAELTGPDGSTVHALVYPPASLVATAPDGEAPPYIVWVHGGPTSRVFPLFDLEKAYFTSRGIGVIDVNYGGSSGYGRAYRERLNGQWGVVDVTDCAVAALALADAGEADSKRLGIRGGSAGGWTALAAVTSGLGPLRRLDERAGGNGVFAAAVSYYGVSDLRGFATHTHDFESRYLDGLIGPLPESNDLYAERAPVGHVSSATCPVLLLQGLDDPIVPPAQAESIASDLAAHGIPYAYLTFAGESHGFRRAETIVACLEAELSFYGQIMGFAPPGVPPVTLR